MKRKGKHKAFETKSICMDGYGWIFGDIEQLPTREDFRRAIINEFLFDIDIQEVDIWYCGLRMAEGEHLWIFSKEKGRGMFPVWGIRK